MTSVTEEMIEAALPCPFCGGPARTFEYNGTTQATCAREYVECAGSDVLAPVGMWNRRAPALEAALSASPAAQTSNLQKMQNAEGWESALHGALISRIMPETRDMTDAEAQALGTDLLGLIRTYAPSAPQPTEPVAHPTPAEAAAQLREYARKQVLAGKTMPGDNIFEDAANLIDRLASPVAQQRDDGWFDMSIAPKNGTRIVVQMPDGPGEEYWYETPAGWRYAALSPERKDQSNGDAK